MRGLHEGGGTVWNTLKESGKEKRGGKTKILERGGGQAGSKGGCLKKGGGGAGIPLQTMILWTLQMSEW